MSRALSPSLQTQIAAGLAMPRSVLTIFLDGSTLRYVDHHANLSFQGNTLTARRWKHGKIKTSSTGKIDSVAVNIVDINREVAGYHAASPFDGRKFTISKIFLNTSTGAVIDAWPTYDDSLLQFRGEMDELTPETINFSFQGISTQDRTRTDIPWRTLIRSCPWLEFCDTNCAYNGGSRPSGTASAGATTSLTSSALVGISSMYGATLKLLTGTSGGKERWIKNHNTGTGQITFDALTNAVVAGDTFTLDCDRSKGSCKNLGNTNNFGGFDAGLSIIQSGINPMALYPHGRISPDSTRKYREPGISGNVLPYVYGRRAVAGTLVKYGETNMSASVRQTRVYVFAAGENDAVEELWVRDQKVDLTQTNKVQIRLGASGDVVNKSEMNNAWDLDVASVRFKDCLFIVIKGETVAITMRYKFLYPAPTSWFANLFGGDLSDSVVAVIRGLKVQKYLSNGNADGAPVWQDNAAWCELDLITRRSLMPLTSADIAYDYYYAAAAACTANNYRVGLLLSEAKSETDTLAWFYTACRGYVTFPNGKRALNVEQALAGNVAHSFDDYTNGKTKNNILPGTFKFPKTRLNDIPNLLVVKFTDEQVRDTVALTTTYIAATDTTVPYKDKNKTFISTGYPATAYINGEAFTYTGNNGTQFTGCSARAAAYPAGYPIYQGQQLYTQETATWRNEKAIKDTRRFIPKQIDGSAIPNHEQAYKIAAYLGKKAAAEAQRCEHGGRMDSLHLTPGDVVAVTHSDPGWVDSKFHVIETSESMDEEVDYILGRYDATVYDEAVNIPPPALASLLASPYAAPQHVTTLVLVEGGYYSSDGLYIPKITLTYSLPQSSLYWGGAVVELSINGGAYAFYDNDDSGGLSFTIKGDKGGFRVSDAVTVRVTSINQEGIPADVTTSPTQAITISGPAAFPAITGLGLESNPGGSVWNGLKFAVTWRPYSAIGGAGIEPAGQEQYGAGGWISDPGWAYDDLELWIGGVCAGTWKVGQSCRWEYIYGDGEDAYLDALLTAANGACEVRVRRWATGNKPSPEMKLALTHAAPSTPSGLTSVGFSRSVDFKWTANTESALSGYKVRTQVDSGTWSNWSTVLSTPSYLWTSANAVGGAIVVIEVKAVDVFNNESGTITTSNSTTVILPDELYTTLRTDFLVRDSIFRFGNNTDAGTTLSWTAGYVSRGGVEYTLSASSLESANNKYVIATLSGSAATLSLAGITSGIPTLTANQVIIATTSSTANSAGNYICYVRQANSMMIEGAIIRDATIMSVHIDSLRGFNIQGSGIMTVGSYFTQAPSAGAGTVYVKDTIDFPSSGTACVIDTTNDRVEFAYTGKTASTLTGCSDVLAHNIGATVFPKQQAMIIDKTVNEMRFWGDAGAGYEELISNGLKQDGSDWIIGDYGSFSENNSKVAGRFRSYTANAIIAMSYSGKAVYATSHIGSAFGGVSYTSFAAQFASTGTSLEDSGALKLAMTLRGQRDILTTASWTLPKGCYMIQCSNATALTLQLRMGDNNWYGNVTGFSGFLCTDGYEVRLYNPSGGTITVYYEKY